MSANLSSSEQLGEIVKADEPGNAAPQAWSRSVYLFFRSSVERPVALLMLIGLSPLLAFLAILVKLDSRGPAFYSQRRMGRHGRVYKIFKLRSMGDKAESRSGAVWSTPNDPRITRVGRWLRATHLDEIPQLWNIIIGDMSLIGPRPERPELIPELQRAYPQYRQRLGVKPGVTGLAQMRRPADVDLVGLRAKLAYDIYYVENVSLALDLKVAISTAMHFTAEVARILCSKCLDSHAEVVEAQLSMDEKSTSKPRMQDNPPMRLVPWIGSHVPQRKSHVPMPAANLHNNSTVNHEVPASAMPARA